MRYFAPLEMTATPAFRSRYTLPTPYPPPMEGAKRRYPSPFPRKGKAQNKEDGANARSLIPLRRTIMSCRLAVRRHESVYLIPSPVGASVSVSIRFARLLAESRNEVSGVQQGGMCHDTKYNNVMSPRRKAARAPCAKQRSVRPSPLPPPRLRGGGRGEGRIDASPLFLYEWEACPNLFLM